MLHLSIEDIQPGMALGKSIYSATGDLLLAAGFTLDEKYIQRLKTLGYAGLYVQEHGTENIIPEAMINEQLALQTNKALRESSTIVQAALKTKSETKEEMDRVLQDTERFKNIILVDKMKSIVDDIITSLLSQQDVLININSIRGKDTHLFQHNLDVTIMSIMLANRLKLNKNEVAEIAMGAMMHDLGMVIIPESIRDKGKRLTFQEFTILKEHPTYGYTILKENPRISPVSAHIAYQHHERQDGAGYPRGLHGENSLPSQKKLTQSAGTIHRYADIVAVADAYDTLVAPRNSHEAKSPEEAIRVLIRSAGTQLNKHVVDALVTLTPAFPVGSIVSIVDAPKELLGCKGVVSKVNQQQLDKPEILVLFNKDGQKIKPFVIDLCRFEMVKIQFVLRR
ncbi:MAG: HD-GYP domain-containing protein [Fibrobacteres bacterium]|nr:HD-GYP domain-containing protein [Fibrobacterota bacterium]